MIEIKNLSKKFPSDIGFKAIELKNISFRILDGKITSIIAPTNSGKSQLLKIISGLEEKTSGDIVNPINKKIIYLPSELSSFPWLNVIENVKLGINRWDEKEIKALINLVGLEGYEKFYPDNNSLGFRFRIALARSLANNPAAILLDEPFKQMDVQTKDEIYSLIREVNKMRNTTFLLATSNLTEAIFLSDKIYLMKNNPTEIISEFDVVLPDDRNFAIYSTDKFYLLRTQIENSFNQVGSQNYSNLSI
jgi:ABC-type nitrate/sulfonate/bicarbonate transport system ATPase subunit